MHMFSLFLEVIILHVLEMWVDLYIKYRTFALSLVTDSLDVNPFNFGDQVFNSICVVSGIRSTAI
jgi:hypothetical protein